MGVIFKLALNPDDSYTESVLHQFTGGNDGAYPETTPVLDSAGNLYATTTEGGAHGAGNICELTPQPDGAWTATVLHHFTGGNDGTSPWAGVIFDALGNLYGTTRWGGLYGNGVVFKLSPAPNGHWVESVLHAFSGGSDGADPSVGGLSFDRAGNLYGVAERGGRPGCDDGCGTVFKLTPAGSRWTFSVLSSFTGASDGGHPTGTPVWDRSGNLYSTAWYRGSSGLGVAFKLVLASNHNLRSNSPGAKEVVLWNFTGGLDGSSPSLGVVLDGLGNLYGVTPSGGENGIGVVYEIAPPDLN
jgi:uncharacterized repeat protein (TIGR03803 family)